MPLLGPRSSQSSTDLFIHLFRVYLPITHVSHACGTSRNSPTRRAVGPGAPPPPHPTLPTSHASTPSPTPGARSHTHTHRLAHTHPPPHSHTHGGDGLGPDRKYPINVYPVTHGAESRASGGLSAMGPGGPVLKTPTQARGLRLGRKEGFQRAGGMTSSGGPRVAVPGPPVQGQSCGGQSAHPNPHPL